MNSTDQINSDSQEFDMYSYLPKMYLFKGIDQEQLRRLLPDMTELSIKPQQDIFRQGDESDALYFIKEGRISVTIIGSSGEITVSELDSGSLFGEIELYTGESRIDTVRTITDVDLIRISGLEFKRIMSLSPDIYRKIGDAIRQGIRRNRLRNIIPKFFGDDLTDAQIEEIEFHACWRHLGSGEFVMRKGDEGRSMSLLVSGRLRALLPIENEAPRVLGDIISGETVGEMSLFSGEPRSADILAVRDSYVVEFSKESFEKITEKYPSVLMRVSEIVIKRLRSAQEANAEAGRLSVVTLVGITNGVMVSEFAQRLTDAIASMATVFYINKEKAEKILGTPGIGEAALGEPLEIRLDTWLNDQEERHDFVFYQCDDSKTQWTQQCVRRADRILFIGHISEAPDLKDFEAGLCDITTVRKDLAIVHSDESKAPVNTMAWLEQRQIQQHYHIRWNVNKDFLRLARFMTGNAVGLVISGGGIRAAAGIGAFRALQEAGIEIDAVGGNSGGSVAAAGIALGWDNKKSMEVLAASMRLYPKGRTWPILSLYTGKHVTNLLKDRLGEHMAENTWRPFFCVTTNVSRGELSVHNSGPLYRLLRTSMSLPGMLPPVVWDKDWHVDGCVASNNPVQIMRDKIDGGRVISIDLFSMEQLGKDTYLSDDIGGFALLWSRFAKRLRGSRAPKLLLSFTDLILRCMDIITVHLDASSVDLVDLHVKPSLHEYSPGQWEAAEEIEAIGYQQTKARLTDWE